MHPSPYSSSAVVTAAFRATAVHPTSVSSAAVTPPSFYTAVASTPITGASLPRCSAAVTVSISGTIAAATHAAAAIDPSAFTVAVSLSGTIAPPTHAAAAISPSAFTAAAFTSAAFVTPTVAIARFASWWCGPMLHVEMGRRDWTGVWHFHSRTAHSSRPRVSAWPPNPLHSFEFVSLCWLLDSS